MMLSASFMSLHQLMLLVVNNVVLSSDVDTDLPTSQKNQVNIRVFTLRQFHELIDGHVEFDLKCIKRWTIEIVEMARDVLDVCTIGGKNDVAVVFAKVQL